MAANVGQLSTDADDGFDLKANISERLLRQQRAVAEGERGDDLNEVAERLGLTGHVLDSEIA